MTGEPRKEDYAAKTTSAANGERAEPCFVSAGDLSCLRYATVEFVLRAEEKVILPPFLGSTIRGSLGHALRKVSCLPLCRDAETCIIRERCVYSYCFETPLPKASTVLR
jgi:hypothetical protein